MHVVCPRCGVTLGLMEPLDREETVQRACQACWPSVTGHPTRFIYVAQDRPGLYRELVEEYRGDPAILVLFDRRQSERRRPADRRKAPRPRATERRTGPPRRRAQVGIVVRGRRGA